MTLWPQSSRVCRSEQVLQLCCISVAAVAALLQLSLSLSTNMYSHAGQILALECLFGWSETLHIHTHSLSLSLPSPPLPPPLSLLLCLCLYLYFSLTARSLSPSIPPSLSRSLSLSLFLSLSFPLPLSQHASHHIHLGNDVCCTHLSIHTSY